MNSEDLQVLFEKFRKEIMVSKPLSNLKLHIFKYQGNMVLCSIPEEELNQRTKLFIQEVFKENFSYPLSQRDCKILTEYAFSHFCTGTYWWFAKIMYDLEEVHLHGGEWCPENNQETLQLMALMATCMDELSVPVMLYEVQYADDLVV